MFYLFVVQDKCYIKLHAIECIFLNFLYMSKYDSNDIQRLLKFCANKLDEVLCKSIIIISLSDLILITIRIPAL